MELMGKEENGEGVRVESPQSTTVAHRNLSMVIGLQHITEDCIHTKLYWHLRETSKHFILGQYVFGNKT